MTADKSQQHELFLKRGERGVLIGQTGSGKTSGAIWQLRNTTLAPVIIFDTKHEPEPWEALPQEHRIKNELNGALETVRDEVLRVGSHAEFSALSRDDLPEYVIVTPTAAELFKPLELLDRYLLTLYEKFAPCLCYVDEAYSFHAGTQYGPGLHQLLTRGRSRGCTSLFGVQRPSFVSRFVFSEAQRMYVYFLSDARDRATVNEFIPGFKELPEPPEHHFYFRQQNVRGPARLFQPVPMYKPLPPLLEPSGSKRTWI